MKFEIVLTALTAGLLLAAGDTQVDKNKRIRGLHEERIAALKEYLDLKLTLRKNAGEVSHEDLLQARLQLLNAQLDASETDQEQIKIHEMIVKLLTEYETAMGAGFKAGDIDITMKIKAKADRLNAEIALERAKVDSNNRLN